MKYELITGQRNNCHTPNGTEYYLNIMFHVPEEGRWTLATWDKEPTEQQIQFAKSLILRVCEVYHEALVNSIPGFSMECINET